MDQLELFNNLMILATADGKLTPEEVAFLAVRAEDLGISQDDVEAALAGASSMEAELVLPTTNPECTELMQQLITLMAVDGNLSEVEKRICAAASVGMGFSTHEFNKIIDSLL